MDQLPKVDPNPQRFPESNFIKFDDYWDGVMSYKSFGYSFSKVDPSRYICSDSEGNILSKPVDEYKSGDDGCDGSNAIDLCGPKIGFFK